MSARHVDVRDMHALASTRLGVSLQSAHVAMLELTL